MLTYTPGSSFAHTLDPRSKLAVQICFVAAAFAYTTPRGLIALTVLTAGILTAAELSPWTTLVDIRYVIPLLLAAPLVEAITLGSPWIVPQAAFEPTLAAYRILLILVVSTAYVRTTPVRHSRAVIQRYIPGRPGQFLGMCVGFVFRFLPVLQADVARIRDAQHARLIAEHPVHHRITHLLLSTIDTVFTRADRFALALQARCLSWNPTLPPLQFSRLDSLALLVAAALAAATLYPLMFPLV